MKEDIQYDVLHPSYKILWDILGEEEMMKVYDQLRGTQLLLPMKLYDRVELEKYLKDNPNDLSVRELSNTFGFSPRWIKKHMK